jgi:hypothetical protein
MIYSIINKGNTPVQIHYLTEGILTMEGTIEVTDGHHTMDELYEHRHRLFLALVKIYDNYITPLGCSVKCWKSQFHDDGSFYEGWFLLGMTVTKPLSTFDPNEKPETYDIAYHLPTKHWHLANVVELPKAPPYDGYTPNDVLERLSRL